MKILQVIPYFSPHRGGSVNVCYNLSKELAKLGHEVTLLTTDYEFDANYASSLHGINVKIFKHLFNVSRFLYSPGLNIWLRDNIKNYDIVHMHEYWTYQNIVVAKYANKYNIPYIIQPHGSTIQLSGKTKLKKIFNILFGYRFFNNASGIIAVSKEEEKSDRLMGIDPLRIHLVYNGMDINKYLKLPERGTFRKKYNINGKMILFLGRIHELKGLDFSIKAFSKLINEVDDATFVIVGPDDGYKASLVRLIKSLSITDKVRFIGYIQENEKLSAYRDADIFIHTVKLMGGVGLTPLEAILCGTPVIVTEECGEIIKESDSGIFVAYDDIDDLTMKMKCLLQNKEKGECFVKHGKEFINKTLSWDNVIKQVELIYEDCIHNV